MPAPDDRSTYSALASARRRNKVVGVISIGDLVKHVISCQQAAIAHLESYIHGGFIAE